MVSGPLAVKSARAIIPGYGRLGAPYGRLIDSEDLVREISPKRPRQASGDAAEEVPASFVRQKLGIESVATTHTTDRLTLDKPPEEFGGAGRPVFNREIEAMTTQALRLALEDYARSSQRPVSSVASSLAGHIHLSWTGDTRQMFALAETRRDVGWHKPGLTSFHILSGCAGLFEALNYAAYLLRHTAAKDDEHALVFITSGNDLSSIAKTRGQCPSPQNEDLDEWLFPAIFGEGAGAIVVGHADNGGGDWLIEDFGAEAVTEDWRVTMQDDRSNPHMVIRARGVRATYRTHVPLAAHRGLTALGLETFEGLHRLCLHESNPNMVADVAAQLGAPAQSVHSISTTVGTLAGVSIFALLDEAFDSHRHTPDARDTVVCAVIGDVGGSVAAGHLALRYQQPHT